MIVRIFLLWLILLPWCLSINESDDNKNIASGSASNYDFMVNNDIYKPTFSRFLDVDAKCAGGRYIPRSFAQSPVLSNDPQFWVTPVVDVSEAIAETLEKFTSGSKRYSEQVTMLIGDPLSGKSVALAKIKNILTAAKSSIWSEHVHLDRIYSATIPLNDITLENMVRKCIKPDLRDSFNNLIKTDPKKIVLLFDGMEHLPVEQAKKVFSIIKTLLKTRVIVVLTGRPSTKLILNRCKIDSIDYIIEEMTYRETEEFLTNIWREKWENDKTPGPSSRAIDQANIETRLKEYAQAFTHVLFMTPLSRQPVALMILADVFKEKSSSRVLLSQNTDYPITCFDYVLNPSSSSPPLFIAIEHALLDKSAFYGKIVKRFRGDFKDLTWGYGILSLVTIIRDEENIEIAQKFLKRFDMEKVARVLGLDGESDLLINALKEKSESYLFINKEFMEYFAAKLVTSSFDNSIPSITIFERFLKIDGYYKPLEFLNYQVKKLPPFKQLSLSAELYEGVLKKTHQYRFENLFRYAYKHISRITRTNLPIAEMTENFFFIAQIETHRMPLGMIRSAKKHPNPFESPSTSVSTVTPMEIWARYGKLSTLQLLQSSRVLFGSNQNRYAELYSTLLRSAALRAVPNLDVVKFFMENIAVSPAHLNTLLFDTINEVGDGCQPIANYLVSRGSQPNVEIEGRTLLHVAVQWNSEHLLSFLVDELKVSTHAITNNLGRTLFSAALDANPSSLYTFPGWWEMMSYLVDHVNSISLRTVDYTQMVQMMKSIASVPKEILESAEVRLMTLNAGDVTVKVLPNHRYDIVLRPIERGFYSPIKIMHYTRFIPFTSWRNVDSRLLALRQNFYLADTKSPLEMLAQYRGVHSLQPSQRQYFNKALNTLMTRERDSLTPEAQSRIHKIFWKNVRDIDDFNDCLKFMHVLGPTMPDEQRRALIQEEVLRWLGNLDIESHSRELTIINRLTQFRTDFIEKKFIKVEVIDRIQNFIQHFEIPVRGDGSKDFLLECVRRNRRRSIRVLSSDCLFSREDVDQFDDAVTAKRVKSNIRVNSEKFLRTLGAIEYVNPGKANQLLSFVRHQLQRRRDIPDIVTGQSQMVVHDLLRYESLSGYRQNQRFASVINELWHPLPNAKPRTFRFPSRTAAFYAASVIPIIRGTHATVQMCLQQHNDTDDHSCMYSSGILALSVMLGPVGTVAVNFVPWMVNKFSQVALDILPLTSPIILRQNIKLIRHYGLKYGAKTAMIGLAIAGVGFDLYNIVVTSKMIDMCKHQGNACTSRDEIELIISLTFSCVSIVVAGGLMMSGVGFIPGLLIGLGLMLLEMFATGINDIIYYSNKYETNFDENARIFFHKIGFQPPPTDVQALARRTNWIEILQKRVNQFLREHNENIVAYGVGIGNMTNDGVIAGFGYIDMENDKWENTRGLSRVLPKASDNTTLLCLPRQDTRQVYEKYSTKVTDAKYRCDNTFVIANKQRWNTRTSDKSYIIYDLGLVNSGTIAGSNTLNNLFLVYNGTTSLKVVGGSGNITNTYMIQNGFFRGSIIMNPSSRNILYLSSLESPILHFWYDIRINMGKVEFGQNEHDRSYLYTSSKMVPNLHVVGRISKPDIFACYYHEQKLLGHNKSVITIDGGGGQSLYKVDFVIDCKISVIRPFTYIMSGRLSNSLYTTQMRLEYSSSRNAITTEKATIIPSKQSKFIVTFSNVPLFASSHGVKYIPRTKTLMWTLQYSKSSSLLLSILSYRLSDSTSKQNGTEIEVVNCLFVDSYSASTIYPAINLPTDGIDTITIQHFDVFVRVNSSRLMDVISHYNDINIFHDDTLFIVSKLTNPKTGESFMFGSSASDRFYIDNNTMYLFGGEGSDIYMLIRESPNYVWIENSANDNALDTLVIPDSSCDILWATRGSDESSYCDSSPYDVTLSCSFRTTTSSPHMNVILRNYLVEPRCRHLQIYWRDATYVLLSDRWSQKSNGSNNTDVKLALLCSFSHQWQTPPTTLTLTSHNTYVVFNGTDDVENLLVAYREQNNIILAKKYFNRDSAFFVKLENFFSNDTNDIVVSTEWQQLKIFSVDNFKDDADPTILTAGDILRLFFNTHFTNLTGTDVNADFTKEYFVNMDDTSRNNTIVIEHEPRSMRNNELDQLGVLVVTGATPGEFQADWIHYNGTALSLCARQACIIIKNWCRSIQHRLYRMEFVFPLYRRPIIIPNLDQLDCQEQVNNRSANDELLKQLNEKFAIAQKQFLLTDEFDDNDDARLLRCIGSVIASNIIDNSSMYRLFGFWSSIDQANFIHHNCPTLFSKKNIEKLSFTTMNTTLENAIEKFQLSRELTQEEQKSILLLRKSFKQLYNHCWDDFKFSLIDHDNRTETNVNIVALQALDQISRVLSKCIHEHQ